MRKTAVIVAGGTGQRMGAVTPKQFLLLKGKPLLWHTINVFVNAFAELEIILVLPSRFLEAGKELCADLAGAKSIQFVEGGDSRFQSVQNGLRLVNEPSIIFVHDSVRCLVTTELIQRCYLQAIEKGSAIPAIPATDSIRIMNGYAHTVANRDHVRIIQTPQTFRSDILIPAFRQEFQSSFTDEATVVEASGKEVFLIEGEYENIKITRPADLLVAESILEERSSFE